MRKFLAVLVLLCIAVSMLAGVSDICCAQAEVSAGGLVMADSISGTVGRPADATQASFHFDYVLPQFISSNDISAALNQFFIALPDELHSFFPVESGQVTFEIHRFSQRYLSIMLNCTYESSSGFSNQKTALSFALDGIYAGQRVTLSQVLGMEQQEELVAQKAYDLVWQIIQREKQNPETDYRDDVTRENLPFHPETEFYLDENDNIVFYIQAGEIAGEIAGTLLYPFSMAEIIASFAE